MTQPKTIRAEIVRTRMAGNLSAYSFEAYIEPDDAPSPDRGQVIHWSAKTGKSRRQCRYIEATFCTDLAPGWDRWDEWKAHERAAHAVLLDALHKLYPETRHADHWPELWLNMPPPVDDSRRAVRSVELPRDPRA